MHGLPSMHFPKATIPMPTANPLKQLLDHGQSFWMDTISRRMIADGTLKRMIREDGLRGVTSNPDIFQKAIAEGDLYDAQIADLARKGHSSAEIYEALAVDDIRAAADVLRPVYDKSDGIDGCISLEVSPYLAFDTAGTLVEGRRLWASVGRPNVFIKVPATPAGLPAIRALLADGINVNVTLIFGLEAYDQVMEAYLGGLEDRVKSKKPIDRVTSVASFFISRIDVLIDRLLSVRVGGSTPSTSDAGQPIALAAALKPPAYAAAAFSAPQHLLGRAAVASAKVAYADFRAKFAGRRWAALVAKGARVQRPLWASTSAKNPLYGPVGYVEPLVGPDTVNTMPMATIDAYRAAGAPAAQAISEGLDEARAILAALKSHGVDLESATWQILEEGVVKFNQPFDKLLGSIAAKRAKLLGFGADTQVESLGAAAKPVAAVLESLSEAQWPLRLFRRDPSVIPVTPDLWPLVANRLGWIDVPRTMLAEADDLMAFAAQAKDAGFKHVVLLGMGGSSLCPDVCAKTFGSAKGYPELVVLDTTSPDMIAAAERRIDLSRSLFIPASKSGGTIETNSLFAYFHARLKEAGAPDPGAHFIAVTDPGTALEKLAAKHGFRRTFLNPPDIGGRYSALSFFGLVPMALMGLDVKALLGRVLASSRDVLDVPVAAAHPAIRLGAALGVLANAGRDKLTLALSPGLAGLGAWIEQLVAESTGKRGKGIVPVDAEPLGAANAYGTDRVFVSIALKNEKADEAKLATLEKAGHPVIRITLADAMDLGAEFFRWEVATTVAGALMGINPFDEPNVSESKANTAALIDEFSQRWTLPAPKPDWKDTASQVALTKAARKAAKGSDDLAALVRAVADLAGDGDYLSILAYLPYDSPGAASLQSMRRTLRDRTHRAVTLGFGPRYLHSTGQLHKGGADNGVFLVVVADPGADLPIPNQGYSFATLIRAQALGDFRSLEAHGRRAAYLDLGATAGSTLKALAAALAKKG